MQNWTGNSIRQKWLNFFKEKGHYIVESKPLIPINDDSLLWINSGIATLKNYFSGKSIPPCPRLSNSQACLRTNDIENVGITSRHQTLFEMLGNFSIGDYFKKEAINFAYELLTEGYKIDKDKLYITVFEEDNEAFDYWIEKGINPNHIIRCNRERNFWDLGQGPCGPCTEIYFDRGEKYDPSKLGIKLFHEDIENDRYIEIWNIVFSQFNNDGNGNYLELERKNIDTGSGLERLASVLQDVPTNFDTDLFLPIIREIEKFTNFKYNIDDYFSTNLEIKKQQTWFRVIADHVKAVVFAVADGVVPGPKNRNYTIRKLIRRVVLYTKKLDMSNNWAQSVIETVINIYGNFFTNLKNKQEIITKTLLTEINSYAKTIDNAFYLFNEEIKNKTLNTKSFFKLVETHGLPIEFAKEFVEDATKKIEKNNSTNVENININWEEFNKLFDEHKIVSKSNQQVVSIEKQNSNLIKCNVHSFFDYEKDSIKGKVIALFNDNFEPVSKINNGNGYVIFDKTVIYATSGGQQFDEGYAKKLFKKIVQFDNVIKGPNLQHLHHFTNASFAIGQVWKLWHDPNWRSLSRKNHSLEHILHSALKKVISETIKQEGAFKNAKKATLDFTYPTKLTDDQLEKIENEIRRIINAKIDVEVIYTDLEGSKKLNAIAYFDDEYKKHDKLRVIKIADYSIELCGGTHVKNTSEIENCFITHHTSQGLGSWRIEIISSNATIAAYLNQENNEMLGQINQMLNDLLKIDEKQIIKKIQSFVLPKEIEELRQKKKEFKQICEEFIKIKFNFEKKYIEKKSNELKQQMISNIKDNFAFLNLENNTAKEINMAISSASNENPDILFVVINHVNNKTQYYVSIKNALNNLNANLIVNLLNKSFNGRGGGKNNYAQGGSEKLINIDEVKQVINENF
ncbi:alanine--tRNA ligase [Mycoplasmoides alvi]|uniref:alanine--tRNA ligase n=1 Tax=Mycoplasmoides alvi TaxID=78580 RepID=UPI00051AFDC9|nr:alanine--tRNA ligase [Mycoplasmoides alvi]